MTEKELLQSLEAPKVIIPLEEYNMLAFQNQENRNYTRAMDLLRKVRTLLEQRVLYLPDYIYEPKMRELINDITEVIG